LLESNIHLCSSSELCSAVGKPCERLRRGEGREEEEKEMTQRNMEAPDVKRY